MTSSHRIVTPLSASFVLTAVAAFVWSIDATLAQSSALDAGILASSHFVAQSSVALAGVGAGVALLVAASRLIIKRLRLRAQFREQGESRY